MATATLMATFSEQRNLQLDRANEAELISGVSRASADAVAKASTRMNFLAGDMIYTEGDAATGAYIVVRGKVKLVANSSDGKALILRIARPGEIISLSAAVSERANDTSAEAVEPTTVSFIKTANLYRLMETQGDLALRLAQELSIEYSSLCQELSTLGLQRSAMSRLAKLLVGLTENVASQRGILISACTLTHEEMAQMIGTSRETVTRLLHDLRDQGIATIKQETLTVSKVENLRALMN